MLYYRKVVYTLLIVFSHLMERSNVAAQMTTFYAPSYGYQMSGKTFFAFMNAYKTWNDAASICKQQYGDRGGSLARIDSKEVMDIIVGLINPYDVWIGLHWDVIPPSTNLMRWDDAFCSNFSKTGYSNFLDNQGGFDSNSRCYFIQSGTWRKQNCNHQRMFVCQYQDTSIDELSDCGTDSDPQPGFTEVQAVFYRKTVDHLTVDMCQLQCAQTLGCFFTTMYRDKRCLMAVVETGNSTISFRNRCFGQETVVASMVENLAVSNNDMTPRTCTKLMESDITVTDSRITSDSGGGSDNGSGDAIDTSPITGLGVTTTITTETVTVTLSASTEILTTTEFVMTSVLVEPSCTNQPVSVTPLISTVTEIQTIVQTETITETAAIPPPATTITNDNNIHTTVWCPTSLLNDPVTTTATEYIQVTLTPSSCPAMTSCSTFDDATYDITASALLDTMPCNEEFYNSYYSPVTITQTICPTPSTSSTVATLTSPIPAIYPTSTTSGNANDTNCPTTKNITLNSSELKQVTESIVQELIVPKNTLSQTRRKKESAPDKRTTAQTSGYLAIFCLAFTFGGVLFADIPILFNQIGELVGNRNP